MPGFARAILLSLIFFAAGPILAGETSKPQQICVASMRPLDVEPALCLSPLAHTNVAARCEPNGAICKVSSDCCSKWCIDGLCTGLGTCTGNGAQCVFNNDCCSKSCYKGLCGGAGGCTVRGAACTFPNECCSNWCHSGKCI